MIAYPKSCSKIFYKRRLDKRKEMWYTKRVQHLKVLRKLRTKFIKSLQSKGLTNKESYDIIDKCSSRRPKIEDDERLKKIITIEWVKLTKASWKLNSITKQTLEDYFERYSKSKIVKQRLKNVAQDLSCANVSIFGKPKKWTEILMHEGNFMIRILTY